MPAAALVLVMTLAPADASPPPDELPSVTPATVEDAGELQGTWEVVSRNIDGIDNSPGVKGDRWVFAGPGFWLDANGIKQSVGTLVRADLAPRPSQFELVASDGSSRKGIYRRVGDELLVAWVSPPRWTPVGILLSLESRPSSFEPTPGVTVWTFTRVKK
jgi:uncharacterized protein (TIGR03067 family)